MSIEARDVIGKNMKILYLIFAKLKALIAEDKFFFSTLFVGVLTCNIMFTYMYGIIAQLNEKDGLADIFVYYTSGEKLSAEQMDTLLDDYTVELHPDKRYILFYQHCEQVDRNPDDYGKV